MKKGQIVQGVIEKVNFPNKGIMHTEEGTCIVKNTIPGQRIEARIQKKKHGKAEGMLLQVLEPSPLEQPSPCPHFGICGGCSYLTLPEEKELALKEGQVYDLLEKAVREAEKKKALQRSHVQYADKECPDNQEDLNVQENLDHQNILANEGNPGDPDKADAVDGNRSDARFSWFEPIRKSPRVYGYRNKMEFTFGDEYKGGPLALGMHKRGSFYDLVTVSSCQIMDGDFRKILQAVRDYWDALYQPSGDISLQEENVTDGTEREEKQKGERVTFFHRLTHQGYLRHLLVRKALHTGEILIDLVTTTQEEHDLAPFTQMLLALPLEGKITGILHTRNDSVADTICDQGTEILYGQDYFYEKLLGLSFRISPFSFFQTNSYGAEVLYETAREFLKDAGEIGGKPVIFDLYSGTGTIGQMLSPAAGRVIGVEIVEEAVEAAKKNAEGNGIANCEFIAGDVLKVLDEIEEKPDVIILDPPRDGVHPKALPKILSYGVKHILYISCKPTSLARDLAAFYEADYEIQRAVCVDQFPWTTGIETVCLLKKAEQQKTMDMQERFTFRTIRQDETEQAAQIEQICFPPNEACSPENMRSRVSRAADLFLVAVDRKTGKIAGFLNGLATDEERLRDDFFTDAFLHQPEGKNIMLTGLDVLPAYRQQGLARALVSHYQQREKQRGRRKLILTCLQQKVQMYQKFGFVDEGISDSQWGGEAWHEMSCTLDPSPAAAR